MSVRFLHLADCHLGALCGDFPDGAPARREEIKATFRAALEWVMTPANAVDGVLVSGDLFDSRRPDSDTLALVRGLFARMIANGKTVVIVPGFNDGFAYPDSVFRSERFPGVDVITAANPGTPLVREIGGAAVHFYGVTHVPGRSPETFPGFVRANDDGIHIGLVHGTVPGHAEESTRPSSWKLPLAALAEAGLDYVAIGGCHQRTEYRFDDGRAAAYAGALEGVRFAPGDLGRKSLTVVTIAPGSATIEAIPFSRKVLVDDTIDLDRESIRDAQSLRAAFLARAGADVFARFTLCGTREFTWDKEALLANMEERFAALKIVDRTSFEKSSLLLRIGSENTIRGFFVRKMRQRLEKLREMAKSPYANRDIDRQIAVAERALTLGIEQFLEQDAISFPTPAVAAAPAHANGNVASVALNGAAAALRTASEKREVVIEGGG